MGVTSYFNMEQMSISLDKPKVRKIAVCILYKPPNGDIRLVIQDLSNSVEYIQSNYDTEIVIMGDMNVNYRQT